MRIVGALIVWIMVIGGLLLYTQHRDMVVEGVGEAFTTQKAAGRYVLTVTTTFDAEPDPFALTTESAGQPAALLVRMGDRTLLRVIDRIAAGQPIRVTLDGGLATGVNEIYVEASPPLSAGDRAQAVRIQILNDDVSVAEQTFWSSAGGKVAETFRFQIDADREEKPDEHA